MKTIESICSIPQILVLSGLSSLSGAIATGLLRGRSVYDITFITADVSIVSGAVIAGGMIALACTVLNLTLSLHDFYSDIINAVNRRSDFIRKYLWLSFTPFVIVPYAANVTLATGVTLAVSSVFYIGVPFIF